MADKDLEDAVAAAGGGSSSAGGGSSSGGYTAPTDKIPDHLLSAAEKARKIDANRSLLRSGASLEWARNQGTVQQDADGAWVRSNTLDLNNQRFNVGGGVMLTYGQMVNELIADPNSDDSNKMKTALVSGRFLNSEDVGKPEAVEAALSDAVRVRSAQTQAWSPVKGGLADIWATTAAYDGYSEDRFAGPGGAYSGPVSTVTEMNVEDLKNIANQTAGMLVGRAVSDEEFAKMLKKVRKAEKKDPRITDSSVDGKVSVEEGISAAGRQSIIRDALVNTEEADGVIKATTMMSNFDTWLRSKNG